MYIHWLMLLWFWKESSQDVSAPNKHSENTSKDISKWFLWNQLDRSALQERLRKESFERVTLSFYAYSHVEDPQSFRDSLYAQLCLWHVLGRVYVASEGINAQVSAPKEHLVAIQEYMHSYFPSIFINQAVTQETDSFIKLIIKVREKIVAHGDTQVDMSQVGPHLDARQWHEFMDSKDAVLVDVRNIYEHEVGHFCGAKRMATDTFREQCAQMPEVLEEHKDQPILLYCTGGIRCEKASALLMQNGFSQVYQLKGGITNYKKQIDEMGLKSRFIGKNFVFDQRLGERITEDVIARCHSCGEPCDEHTNCAWQGCHILFIQCSKCAKELSGCCSKECAQKSKLPREDRLFMLKNYPEKVSRYKSSFDSS